MSSFSIASFRLWIWLFSWLPSLVVTEQEITCAHERAGMRAIGTMTERPRLLQPVLSEHAHRPSNATCAAQCRFGWHKNVGHILRHMQRSQLGPRHALK